MNDSELLTLYTKLCGFKLLVLANRAGATSRFSRVIHDRLIGALDHNVRTCSQAMAALLKAQQEHWTERAEQLFDEYNVLLGSLESGGKGFYPWHLLDHFNPALGTGGYVHPVFGVWCKGPIPDAMTVGDEHLDGLGVILRQIAEETGFRFTVYLWTDIGPEGPGALDPDLYERPAGRCW